LAIQLVAGDAAARLKYVIYSSDVTIDEYATHSSTLVGHPASPGVIAVGAVPWYDPTVIEPFSSRGDTTIYFDAVGDRLATPEVRQKPDVVAPDNVNTTFFGEDIPEDADEHPNFIGTSAAAPHVAGAAALILDANPHLTADELRDVLTTTAIDLGAAGYDPIFGHGLVDVEQAVAAARAIPDVTEPFLLDISPDPIVGWDVTFIWGTFSEPLDSAKARNGSLYDLSEAGQDRIFGTGDDITYSVEAVYDNTARSVTLTVPTVPDARLGVGDYRLEMGEAISDPTGNSVASSDEIYEFVVSAEPPVVSVPGSDRGNALAVRNDGQALVAHGYNPRLGGYNWPQVVLTHYDVNGHKTAPGLVVPTDQDDFSVVGVDVAYDNSGGALVWANHAEKLYGEPDGYSVCLQLLDASGRPDGQYQVVSSVYPKGEVPRPKVAMSDDRIVVVSENSWYSNDNDYEYDYGVTAEVLDRQGNTIRASFEAFREVLSVHWSKVTKPNLAMDAAGNFVVTWDSVDVGHRIRARRFDSDGNPLGDAFDVGTSFDGEQSSPSVGMTTDGRFVVIWNERTQDDHILQHDYSFSTFVRFFDSAGTPTGPQQRLFPTHTYDASLGMPDDDHFILTWRGYDADSHGVYVRRYTLDGAPVGEIHRLNASETGFQSEPQIALTSDGRFVASWHDKETDEYLARWCSPDCLLPVAGLGPWGLSVEGVVSGSDVLGAKIMFDRPIDPATFTASDVVVRDPGGSVVDLREADPITSTADPKVFEIHLTNPYPLAGTYRLAVGPHIADLSGREMNQNMNVTNGETEDTYDGTFDVPSMPMGAFPLVEDLEDGNLGAMGKCWSFATEDAGMIQVTSAGGPRAGTYHLLMDQPTSSVGYETAILHLDLAGNTGVMLDFWAKELHDSEDDLYLLMSAHGATWHEIVRIRAYQHGFAWIHYVIDLDAAIAAAAISYSSDFQLKFQHDGDHNRESAFALDDIRVMTTSEDLLGTKIVSMSAPGAEAGFVEYVEVTFDEDVQPESFGADDVVIKPPVGGTVPLRQTDPVIDMGDHRTFRIYLAEVQSLGGTWQVTVGPEIFDTSVWHNPMNQDGDIAVGEPRDRYGDAFVGTFEIPAVPVTSVSYAEGFEGGTVGALEGHWSFATDSNGLMQVTSTGGPRSGTYHLLMDQPSFSYGSETAILHLDLAGKTGVTLDFWAKQLYDRDGNLDLSISADGETWHRIVWIIHRQHVGTWFHHVIDLDAAIAAAAISYTSDLQLRFYHKYGYSSRASAFALDDIRVMTTGEDVFGPKIVSMSAPGALAGLVEYVDVTFNEDICPESFGADDVVIKPPVGGTVPLRQTDPVIDTGDHRTFRIYLAEGQSLEGTWQVTVGPDVLDASPWHNPMNQDDNTTIGSAADAYIGTFVVEPPMLMGDIDGNGVVDKSDYGILISQFGQTGNGYSADFNGDEIVDIVDFAMLRANFGTAALSPTTPIALPATVHTVAITPAVGQFPESDVGEEIYYPTETAPTDESSDWLAPSTSIWLFQPPGRRTAKRQSLAAGYSATTLYRAATAEDDLRTLGDDLLAGNAAEPYGDLYTVIESYDALVDILSESPVAVPI